MNKSFESIVEKETYFNIKYIESLDDFNLLKTEIQSNDKLIFRGVHNSSFRLFNTLQLKLDIQYSITEVTDEIIKKATANGIIKNQFDVYNVLSIISFLRHYGASLPVMDFTKDFDIALYFAFKENNDENKNREFEKYFSIYCIDSSQLSANKNVHDLSIYHLAISSMKKEKNNFLSNFNIIKDEPLEFLSDSDESEIMKKNGLGKFLGLENNKNIIEQKGVFLFNNGRLPIEELILKLKKKSVKIKCYEVNKTLRNVLKIPLVKEDYLYCKEVNNICDDVLSKYPACR